MRSSINKNNSIQFGTIKISSPEPVVNGRLYTKAGRMCLKGTLNNRPVKVYECAHPEHARFVSNIMQEAPLEEFFPKVYGIHDRFIISEWVDGKELKPRTLSKNRQHIEKLDKFITRLHATRIHDSAGFDYFTDYIHPRFKKCCEVLGLIEFYNNINDLAQTLLEPVGTKWLSHPDITPANIIVTRSGQIKVIDNELLSVSCLPVFDQLNIIYGFGYHIVKNPEIWSPVFAPLKEYLSENCELPLLSIWIMRITGSYFLGGNIGGILKIAATGLEEHRSRMGVWKILHDLVNV